MPSVSKREEKRKQNQTLYEALVHINLPNGLTYQTSKADIMELEKVNRRKTKNDKNSGVQPFQACRSCSIKKFKFKCS